MKLHSIILKIQRFLENIDGYRDKFLFIFIKPYWPRKITPNHITWIRVFIAIVLFILIFVYKIHDKNLIIALFTIGVLTDLLDGSIARGLNKITEFGAMLDSTADRAILLPIAIYSLVRDYKILLFVLIMMELFNAAVSIFYKSKEIYLESNIFGKTKMFLISMVFIVMIFVWPSSPPTLFVLVLWLTVPFTLLSMFTRINELLEKQNAKA